MKKFPTLYSISSLGKPLEWTIIAEYDYFYTVAGQIGGQLVTSEPNYCVAKNVGKKNATSAEEQAIAEAESKWKKKLKTDYFENLEDVTDSSKEKYFEPMLAKVYKDRKDKVVFPVIVDAKYDGIRFVARKSGVYSRKGERILTVPHIEESLKGFFKENPNAILDGEGYSHEYRHELNTLMSILRKTKNISEEDLELSRLKVSFYIYDGFGFNGITQETKQFERRKKIVEYFDCNPKDYIVYVEGYTCNNENEINAAYKKYLELEYEGAMVRLNGHYKNGRSADLLKLKEVFDDEGIVLNVLEGSGNWGGVAKMFSISWHGSIFNATIKGNYEECYTVLLDKDKYIGKEVTFYYNDLTGLGIPNYPRVDINNCFKKL